MIALTREISPSIVSCELTHLDRTPIDLARARAEHDAYEAALRECGCEVRRLPADETMADSVFIEDTAIVLDELAIITRPGAPSRRAETDAVREALREHRALRELSAPAILDGGDVLRIGRRLLAGVGPRSNDEGRRQLAAFAAPHGYSVEAVPFAGCLHLKTAVTLVADDTVLFNPEWVDASALGVARAIPVDPAEPFAGNAVRLGEVVIHPAEFPRTRASLERAGIRVRTVPAGELARAEGGVTCCSLLVGRPGSPLRTAMTAALEW
ncbi:MAG TPA: arginine deiminase family protein [Gemmatimonadaceae bacterium]|nr:arginine deiminase family protein [Gemmatimonadaceae bacterium]